jgi:hypothetical protein
MSTLDREYVVSHATRYSASELAELAAITAQRDARCPDRVAEYAAADKMIEGGASVVEFALECCNGEIEGAPLCYLGYTKGCDDPVIVATIVKSLREFVATFNDGPVADALLHGVATAIEGCPAAAALVGVTESDHDQRVAHLRQQVRELRTRLRSVSDAFAVECANLPQPPRTAAKENQQ